MPSFMKFCYGCGATVAKKISS